MRLEDQVCSLELAKKLKELGVKQESAFYWNTSENAPLGPVKTLDKYPSRFSPGDWCAAFTVAELGELLGRNVNDVSWHVAGWREWIDIGKEAYHYTEANARASRLIYLIEQGIVKPNAS